MALCIQAPTGVKNPSPSLLAVMSGFQPWPLPLPHFVFSPLPLAFSFHVLLLLLPVALNMPAFPEPLHLTFPSLPFLSALPLF